MIVYSHVYVITRREGDAAEPIDAHRRLEHARKQLEQMRNDARAGGCRTMLTQSGCCLRTQKGASVIYYEINKMLLK